MKYNFFSKIILLLVCLLIPTMLYSQEVYRAWFTDATASEFTAYGYTSTQITRPVGFPTAIESAAYGTRGNGVDLSYPGLPSPVSFQVNSLAIKTTGVISFWISLNEDGAVGSGSQPHYILEGGNMNLNTGGFRISWDNSAGKSALLFQMAGRKNAAGDVKLTACQYDISDWEVGDWHHIQVAWLNTKGGTIISRALAMWVDRVCVSSVAFDGITFMSYGDTLVKIGGDSGHNASCYIDELIFRRSVDGSDIRANGGTPLAYKDFFLTAPYTAVNITHMPYGASDMLADPAQGGVLSVPSDPWILLGKQKQFGLIGTRKLNTSGSKRVKEYLTEFTRNNVSTWSQFDAKPVTQWLVTGGASLVGAHHPGLIQGDTAGATPIITTIFRTPGSPGSLSHFLQTSVRAWEGTDAKPDLGIMYVSRTPRISSASGNGWPSPGQQVTSTVYFGNFGTADLNQDFTIKFELCIDSGNDFRLDGNESWVTIGTTVFSGGIHAGDYYDSVEHPTLKAEAYWVWPWTLSDPDGLNEASYWIRVTLDYNNFSSGGEITEICEANNRRTEKTNAKILRLGYHKVRTTSRPDIPQGIQELVVDEDWSGHRVNMVGSFSDFDYFNAYADRINVLVQTTKNPLTAPQGIQEGVRVDEYVAWTTIAPPGTEYNDGCYPEIKLKTDSLNPLCDMYLDDLHELGHVILRFADYYGSIYPAANVLLESTGSSSNFPYIAGNLGNPDWDNSGLASQHPTDHQDEFILGYTPLMDSNHLWLHSINAGQLQYLRHNRQTMGPWLPWFSYVPRGSGLNKIRFTDVNGGPLKNARVYVYQLALYDASGDYEPNKYVPLGAKFTGHTGISNGIFTFPTTSSNNWDDWGTPGVEREAVYTSPFDHYIEGTTDTGVVNSWTTTEQCLIKIVALDPVTYASGTAEYHLLSLSELNKAFFGNGGDNSLPGLYSIHTSLISDYYAPAISLPDAVSPNAQPVAILTGPATVAPNTTFIMDGSASHDGDSGTAPLWYWWKISRLNNGIYETIKMEQTCGAASSYTVSGGYAGPANYKFELYVMDGIKVSEIKTKYVNITN